MGVPRIGDLRVEIVLAGLRFSHGPYSHSLLGNPIEPLGARPRPLRPTGWDGHPYHTGLVCAQRWTSHHLWQSVFDGVGQVIRSRHRFNSQK